MAEFRNFYFASAQKQESFETVLLQIYGDFLVIVILRLASNAYQYFPLY